MAPGELDLVTAAALGALQGIAEFLPISSSGHLALANAMLGIDAEETGHSFNIIVHAGTLLAVLVVFGRDLAGMLRALVTPAPKGAQADQALPPPMTRDRARNTVLVLFLGCLPLAAFVLPGLEDLVISIESQVRLVGVALLMTAAMLLFTHRRQAPTDERLEPPTKLQAVLIGIAQFLAVVPGISRSGSTIAAGLALGMGRARAARFSFLLSIPAILGASAKEALDLARTADASFDALPFAVGFVVSFLTGLVALQGLLRLIERFGMLPFVPYLVVVGLAAIIVGG